jgi:predicted O-methyltransferase YrrM
MTLVFPEEIAATSALTEAEAEALAALAEDRIVLEMGAWTGLSTVCMAQTAKLVYSVDWHRGDPHAGETSTLTAYFNNLYRYGLVGSAALVAIVGRFEDVCPAFQPAFFDVIFLDGFHGYEQVRADIDLLEPLLRPGGTLAFHDYGVEASSRGGGAFGVTRAVDERFEVSEAVDTLAIVKGDA